MKRWIQRCALGCVAWSTPWMAAHDSPEHVIERLGGRVAAEGASAYLLTRRAYEYQALGNWEAAIADFRSAIALEPRSSAALTGCAEALLHQGAWREAESVAQRGVALHEAPAEQAPFHALLARVHTGQQQWTNALAAWRNALRSPRPEIDWFLGEADCLERLGHYAGQVTALAAAMERNPSIVLRRAWIHALVNAGQLERAAVEIEAGLANARWQSAWLILRARVRAQQRDHAGQRADAAAALEEIRGRLNPHRPEPQLLAEVEAARGLMRR